jgi:histidinol-phosphate aminotransferase
VCLRHGGIVADHEGVVMTAALQHGGPDGGEPIAWDFSSNANAVPLPAACQALLLDADRSRYPDPHYATLREHLAHMAHATPSSIVPTAGTSEGIRRMTLAAHLKGVRQVWVPEPAYGDYAAAAQTLNVEVQSFKPRQADWLARLTAACAHDPVLLWLCEPCNPTGGSLPPSFWSSLAVLRQSCPRLIVALDRAYEPLRLEGVDPVPAILSALSWQCWSPNKALGLTGVRAGWLQAPRAVSDDPLMLRETMLNLAPSWVLSAEGVNLLMHWHDTVIQRWLTDARHTLTGWRQAQQASLTTLGWTLLPSCTPFFLARPAQFDTTVLSDFFAGLRGKGIKLRDASSFGLNGHVRLRVLQPSAQQALISALTSMAASRRTTGEIV